jgi:hypothetical protein
MSGGITTSGLEVPVTLPMPLAAKNMAPLEVLKSLFIRTSAGAGQ